MLCTIHLGLPFQNLPGLTILLLACFVRGTLRDKSEHSAKTAVATGNQPSLDEPPSSTVKNHAGKKQKENWQRSEVGHLKTILPARTTTGSSRKAKYHA